VEKPQGPRGGPRGSQGQGGGRSLSPRPWSPPPVEIPQGRSGGAPPRTPLLEYRYVTLRGGEGPGPPQGAGEPPWCGLPRYLDRQDFTEIFHPQVWCGPSGAEGGVGLFGSDYFEERPLPGQTSPAYYKQIMVVVFERASTRGSAPVVAHGEHTQPHLNEYLVPEDVEDGFPHRPQARA
jgi:hypothetical protein